MDSVSSSEPQFGAESWWLPRHYIFSAWTEHAPFAFHLMAMHRPSSIVELGTHTGFSLFVFAEAAQRLGIAVNISAIDTWQGDDHAGFYGEDVFTAVERTASNHYGGNIRLLRSTFSDAAVQIPDRSIDLLHIDGRHGYEDVKEDFYTYAPKLSSRAVVLFHDSAETRPGFGVHRFWDEIRSAGPSFQFEHGHGLGVLALGDGASEVRAWIDIANSRADATKSGYQSLGSRVGDYFSLSQLPSVTDALRADNAFLTINLARSSEQAAAAAQVVDELKRSSSWRVTAPLRFAARILRRARG